jgi:ATP-binding protein involved in chromosome partitioning
MRFSFRRPPTPVTADAVWTALSQVLEPEVNRDLVSLGMVQRVSARDGRVSCAIRLREAGTPLQAPIERRTRKALLALPGVKAVEITFEASPGSALRDTSRLTLDASHVVAVASGKGGVGKSTVAVSLAVALSQLGQRVGLLDADIHGPNLPQMMGLAEEQPIAFGQQIFPPQAHGVTVMSMGLLVPPGAPIVWRGPMLHQAVRQLLRDVLWGELDILIVDLPPGTGDVQLTLCQTLPLAGAVLVTTPQSLAQADALKAGEMFRQLQVPIAGVIENMSYYVCQHCGRPESIFGEGGGDELAHRLAVPVLVRIPLDPAVRAGGDNGLPAVLTEPTTAAAIAFRQAAQKLATHLAAIPRPSAAPPYRLSADLPVLGQ